LLAKLGRVLLLIPLSLLLMVWMKRAGRTGTDAKIAFPWFLLGFIVMSCLGSFLIGKYILIPQAVMNGVSSLTTFLLAMAMAGLGLNVDLRQLRAKALRPLFAMLTASLLLSLLTLATL
ncbi:putative sulfate exporter family transporter, partial [Paenibacillus macerans]